MKARGGQAGVVALFAVGVLIGMACLSWLSFGVTSAPGKPQLQAVETAVAGAELVKADVSAAPTKSDDSKGGSWGNVKGQIVLDAAAAPEPAALAVTKDQNVCLAKGPLTSEDLIVNKTNLGVKNVFVWLMPVNEAKPLAVHPDLKDIKQQTVEVDQPCCMFVPHALCMRQGQVLVAKNPATISHNFHYTGHPLSNPGANQIIPAGGDLKIPGLKADKYPIKMACDIHPWMSGWIRVFDHPYFALTDADGKYEIKNAPAGPCLIYTWQEGVGWVEGDKKGTGIEVPAGKTLDRGVVKMKQP
jgi:hypothetical protein